MNDEVGHQPDSAPSVDPTGATHCDLEFAHVLFLDVVAYSPQSIERQRSLVEQLQTLVHGSPRVREAEAAHEILSLPTGDGMAIVFFRDPSAPAQAAIELTAALKPHPELRLRMGIHSGPVYRVSDVNQHANVAGGGINMAQRVMDCGDAGHILLSQSSAEVLTQMAQWAPHLVSLGECEVKHGVKVRIYNLVSPDWGNAARPAKLARLKRTASTKKAAWASLAAALALGILAGILSWNRGSAVQAAPPSIAVLPFADMSPEKNQGYFSDGLAEELLDGLAKVPGLRVAGRASSFQFRDQQDFRVIAERLHVNNILGGSVRKRGDRARIGVQLIQADDGFQLWSETFDRDLRDVLAVQQEIARSVTDALKVRLMQSSRGSATANPEAYNSYLLGRYFYERSSRENLELAANNYGRAVALEAGYAPAWMGLGEVRMALADAAYIDVSTGYAEAGRALETAVRLDGTLGEAFAALGWLKIATSCDWAGAEEPIRRALQVDPNNPQVIRYAARLARARGRWAESIELNQRGVTIDPLSSRTYHNLGFALYYGGRANDAVAAIRRALELTPGMAAARLTLTRSLLAIGQKDDALKTANEEKHPAYRLLAIALATHAAGSETQSRAAMAELEAKYSVEDAFQIAEGYAFRGDKDRAFTWLERARAQRDPGFSELKGDPLLRSLETDPRYAAFLSKIGSP